MSVDEELATDFAALGAAQLPAPVILMACGMDSCMAGRPQQVAVDRGTFIRHAAMARLVCIPWTHLCCSSSG